jgi:protein-disulfide isomerase
MIGAAAAVAACTSTERSKSPAAVVDRTTITVGNVDDWWAAHDPAGYARVLQQVYAGRRAALESMLDDRRVTAAAHAASTTPDAYEAREVGRRVRQVADADVAAFYEAQRAARGGQPFDAPRSEVLAYLQRANEQSARDRWLADVRRAAAPARVLLPLPPVPPAVQASDHVLGGAAAPVTLIEYVDFECPYCRQAAPVVAELRRRYGTNLRVVVRDFPLTEIHQHALAAAEAGRCAADQQEFWRFHAALFGSQAAPDRTRVDAVAAALGLDRERFRRCVDTHAYRADIERSIVGGRRAGVRSTPTMFVNGRMIEGAQPLEAIADVIDQELRASASAR